MSYLQYHYSLITKKELISKFYFKNNFQLPALKCIYLNIGILNNTNNKYFIIPTLLVLELLINTKHIKLNKSKKNNLILKIKKQAIVGCSFALTKNNKYMFLQKLILFYFTTEKEIKLILNNKNFSFQLHNFLIFVELEKYFNFFNKINYLTINFQFNTTNELKINTLLTSLKFPIK